MRTRLVAVDIDNTLAEYTAALRDYVQGNTSLEYPCPDPNLYDFGSQTGWPWRNKNEFRQTHSDAVQAGLYLTERPYPQAAWALRQLQQNACRIIIATSRTDDKNGDTRRWLDIRQIPYDGLFFGDKLDINADLWIEDNPNTLSQLENCYLPAMHPAHEYCRDAYGRTYSEWKDVPQLALDILSRS